jgi:lysozyme
MRHSPFILIAALMALALAACTTTDYDFADIRPPSGATEGLRFGDRDPQDFGRRGPATYPIHGIDVSKWQGDIDWSAVRQAGIAFAFIKATEGGDRFDDRFNEYWRQSRAVGIPRSAYHFYYFCRPAIEQARWFIANVPREAGTLPHVLDMEWNHLSPSCRLRPPPETVRREMKIFLDAIEAHYGKRPIIYTTIDFHRTNIDGHFTDYPMWLRAVAEHPDTLYPGHNWMFWQYTGTGIVPGIRGDTDINVFAGTRESWQRWLQQALR